MNAELVALGESAGRAIHVLMQYPDGMNDRQCGVGGGDS